MHCELLRALGVGDAVDFVFFAVVGREDRVVGGLSDSVKLLFRGVLTIDGAILVSDTTSFVSGPLVGLQIETWSNCL